MGGFPERHWFNEDDALDAYGEWASTRPDRLPDEEECERSIALARDLLHAFPDSPEIQTCAAQIFLNSWHEFPKYTEAQHLCERAIAMDPRCHNAHHVLAFCFYLRCEYADAIESGRRAVEIDGHFMDYDLLADIHEEACEYPEAIALLKNSPYAEDDRAVAKLAKLERLNAEFRRAAGHDV